MIDDDLFKTIAQNAGLKAYGESSDEQKGVLGQLKNAVETEIDREQQRTGKPLTRDEKQRLMQGVIDQKVMLHYSLWPDESRIAATVTNADDRARAYVPLANIPPVAMSEALNYARSLSPELQPHAGGRDCGRASAIAFSTRTRCGRWARRAPRSKRAMKGQ